MSAEELGGADLHCSQSGVTDHYALDDMHAVKIAKNIVSHLNHKKEVDVQFEPAEVGNCSQRIVMLMEKLCKSYFCILEKHLIVMMHY